MIPGDPTAYLVEDEIGVAQFTSWLSSRLDTNTPLAIDTETTGLEWWTPQFTRLVTIADDNEGYAIPTEYYGRLIYQSLLRINEAHNPLILQNAKFDQHALSSTFHVTLPWHRIEDTKILMHLRRSDLSSALKGPQTADLLGKWVYRGQNDLRQYFNKHKHTWASVPVDEPCYWVYGVLDTIITRRLWDALADIRAGFQTAYDRERSYQAVMFEVEQRGILLDHSYTQKLSADLAAQAEQELAFLRASGLHNPNSQQQLVALLEADFGWVPTTFTDSGQPATDKNVLQTLAAAGDLQADLVESLIRYKRAVKWKSSYADQFLQRRDRLGRVHPDINTLGARTGRSSVRNPALQTLPSGDPLIRKCLLPDQGYRWWSIDFSNQEPRALAHYGESPELIRYFTEGDGTGSVHDFVAGQMFGPSYSPEQRSLAKVFGLSRSYGAGPQKMAQASGLPENRVRDLLPAYDALVGLDKLNDRIYETAADRQPHPFIVTSGGRRVYSHPEEAFKLVNYLCQGSGADMLKDAVNALATTDLIDFLLLPVHDELCFQFPKEEGPQLAQEAATIMEEAADQFVVPMPVDITGPGKSWGGLYE